MENVTLMELNPLDLRLSEVSRVVDKGRVLNSGNR